MASAGKHSLMHARAAELGAADPDEEKPHLITSSAGVAQHRNFRTDGIGEDGLRHKGATQNDARVTLFVGRTLSRLVRGEVRELGWKNPGAGTELLCNSICVDERKSERIQVRVVERRLARSVRSSDYDQ